MKADRVVLDTNVLISAVLTQTGPPRRVVDLVRADNGVLLFSDETFAELRHRILGPKFDRYVGRESRAAFAALLAAVAEWVPITGARLGCHDPTDDKILETALMGRADHLVTGDGDLLAMSPFHGIPIVTPALFLALHGQTSAVRTQPTVTGAIQPPGAPATARRSVGLHSRKMFPHIPDFDHPRLGDNAEVNPVLLADGHVQLEGSATPLVVGKDAEVAIPLHRWLALGVGSP